MFPLPYVSPEERTRNLVDFQQKGGVFVCTDAASRGLDIPHISHIIQVLLFLLVQLF